MTEACAARPATSRAFAGAEPEIASAGGLYLADCDRLELMIGLYEHEKAGLRFESWPPEIQRRADKFLAEWQAANPTRALRCMSTAVTKVACVMVIHHAAKG